MKEGSIATSMRAAQSRFSSTGTEAYLPVENEVKGDELDGESGEGDAVYDMHAYTRPS